MTPTLGANYKSGKTTFTVWSPLAKSLEVVINNNDTYSLSVDAFGYWTSPEMDMVQPGDRYQYCIDGGSPRPDPVSLSQPDGVHGASEVVDLQNTKWTDSSWKGIALPRYGNLRIARWHLYF